MKTTTTGETRRNIILPDNYDADIGVISDFLQAIGSQGTVSAAIRYALRVAAADLRAKGK